MGNDTKIFEFENSLLKGTIGLPYVILDAKKSAIFRSDNTVKESYTYPEVPEPHWIQAFHESFQSHKYNAKRYEPVKTTKHYCEFSGWRPLYF